MVGSELNTMEYKFQTIYPHLTRFVQEFGWIEVGYDEDSPLTSFIRAVNIGGMVWEGKDKYDSFEDAFGILASKPDLNAAQKEPFPPFRLK